MRRNQYDPEFSESTELGIKTFLFDRRVQLNAAYFMNDYAGKQEESTQVDPQTKLLLPSGLMLLQQNMKVLKSIFNGLLVSIYVFLLTTEL